MNTYVNKKNELIVTTEGTITEVAAYNDKSVKFTASTPEFGIIEGFMALSLDSTKSLVAGVERQFTCPRDILTGADPSRNGKEANFLWSVSVGRSTPLSASILDALKAL